MNAKVIATGKLLFGAALVSASVALTYTIFENGVNLAIDVIWKDIFKTDEQRLLIIPIIVIFTLIFFWLQHVVDRPHETHEAQGLGDQPSPTLKNLGVVLITGFFSLVAGASLGPEAVLVPASTILGAYIGASFLKGKQRSLLTGMGIIALFTAFFHSAIIGVLSIFLLKKQMKANITAPLLLLTLFVAALTLSILTVIDSKPAITLPAYDWAITLPTIVWSLFLVAGGYIVIHLVARLHDQFRRIYTAIRPKSWWIHGGVAAAGLVIFYLIGGPLVQFTGNHSIVPLAEQATTLGVLGVVWIVIIKAAAIAWSKALGYHGGMIFPTIFLAAGLVVLIELYTPHFNSIYGLIAVMIGAFIANQKTGVLA